MRGPYYKPLDEVRARLKQEQSQDYGYTDTWEWLDKQIKQRLEVIPPRFSAAESQLELGETGLYLWGPVGVGKTHAAAGIANKLIAEGFAVQWITASAWLAAIRASYNGGPTPKAVEVLADADVLVLDDLGAERPTEWAVEQLLAAVNGLYEREGRLIVTSNLKLAALDKHLGKRIVSRIAELCDTHEMSGPDRRLLAARNRKEVQ